MRSRIARRTLITIVAVTLSAANTRAGALPDWLDAALATPSPAGSEHHAHLLLQEQFVSLRTPGQLVTRERGAVRILDRQGAGWARTQVSYYRSSARVKSLRGWLARADGNVRVFGRNDAVDLSLTSGVELQSEVRQMVLVAADAEPGSVFAWEWIVEEDPLLAEQVFWFGASLPCARQAYELELAPGAEPRTVSLQGSVPPPAKSGTTWRWERRDVPAWPDEPWSTSLRAWVDRVVLAPEPGGEKWGHSFRTWAEVGSWLQQLSSPSLAHTPEIHRKALEIVGAETRPLERARLLARHAQSVNYLAIAVGLARGEGYRPRPATEVLGTGYGDCKDKASYFCSLARSLGLEAWLASATTLGRDAVHSNWPSPGQFNHCIAALKVPSGSALEAVVEDTSVGPLLFFDATDPNVPFGSVSSTLAGSAVLFEHPERSALLRLPALSPERDLTTSSMVGSLDSAGTLTATWRLTQRGEEAWAERALLAASATEWRQRFERRLADWLGPCQITRLVHEDLPGSGGFQVTTDLVARRYAKSLGANLVGFRTPAMPTPLRSSAVDTLRLTPLALPAYATEESLLIRLPPTWRLEAPPPDVSRETGFARVSGAWNTAADTLRFAFRGRISPETLPPARYPEWRALARAWAQVNRAQVVARKP